MKHNALEYLKRRAAEELRQANNAPSKAIADVHRLMADAYYRQIQGFDPFPEIRSDKIADADQRP